MPMENEPAASPLETTLDRRTFLRAASIVAYTAAVNLLRADTLMADGVAEAPIDPHVYMERSEVKRPTDILRGYGPWTFMDGATLTSNGLQLVPTNLGIVDKRVTDALVTQPNPSFNAYGPHLETNGDFAVSWHVKAATPVALQLYGRVPLRYDDFRFERGRVETSVNGNHLAIRIWDGSSQDPTEHTFAMPPSPHTQDVEVRRVGVDIVFYAHGQQVGSVPKGNIFDSGTVFMGMNSESGPATVRSLKVRPLHGAALAVANAATLRVSQPVPDGLQTLVKRPDFTIGAAVSLNQTVADQQYAELNFGHEVGGVTFENALKPQDTQPSEGMFTLGQARALIDLAERHAMKVHGHTAMYSAAMPRWMRELPTETEGDKQRVRAVLETHIKTVVGAFKGRIASWDVLNEIINGFNDQAKVDENNPWFKALGEEYIDIALRAAHEADPNCKLFLNDFGLETNLGRAQAMLGLVQRLLMRGVPLNGIGIQGHVYELPRDEIKPENLQLIMTTAQTLGLQVRVSELDVTGANGTQPQADQYASTLGVAIKATNCPGLTVWGLTDAYGSTTHEINNRLVPGDNLIYNTGYQPKPARDFMAALLRSS